MWDQFGPAVVDKWFADRFPSATRLRPNHGFPSVNRPIPAPDKFNLPLAGTIFKLRRLYLLTPGASFS
jgi:hypothetical protein